MNCLTIRNVLLFLKLIRCKLDRREVFSRSFSDFIKTQQMLDYEKQERRRYKQPDGSYTYHGLNWTAVNRPNYKLEVMPQTLTDEELANELWPCPIVRITLANQQVIVSYVQESRDFSGLRVDFLGFKDSFGEVLNEYRWKLEDINEYTLNSPAMTISDLDQ